MLRYLGVRAVIAKSFARIHATNLVNFGILPFTFADEADHARLLPGDVLEIEDLLPQLENGTPVLLTNALRGTHVRLHHDLTARQREIVLAGGLLNHARRTMATAGR